MKTLTVDADPLVLVADDGSGRVWVVNDGTGKSWYKPSSDRTWVAWGHVTAADIPGAEDVAYNFAELNPKWHPEVAAMLVTVRSLAKHL